nr:DUF3265 domain-containing protein [Vibrio vulnificus]
MTDRNAPKYAYAVVLVVKVVCGKLVYAAFTP